MKVYTVKSLFAAAATIHFDEILVQNLLSKNYVLSRLLFKGDYYLRAATNNDFTVFNVNSDDVQFLLNVYFRPWVIL